jgi:hypothetical protein
MVSEEFGQQLTGFTVIPQGAAYENNNETMSSLPVMPRYYSVMLSYS